MGKVYTDVTISNIANINICRACMETGEYAWQCLNICLAVRISDRRTKKYIRISVLTDCLFTINTAFDELIFLKIRLEFMIMSRSFLQDLFFTM